MPLVNSVLLEVRVAHGWHKQQTADAFLVTAATAVSWVKWLDELGTDAFVQICEPVNKFPDFVRYAVQRRKSLYPTMGKVKNGRDSVSRQLASWRNNGRKESQGIASANATKDFCCYQSCGYCKTAESRLAFSRGIHD